LDWELSDCSAPFILPKRLQRGLKSKIQNLKSKMGSRFLERREQDVIQERRVKRFVERQTLSEGAIRGHRDNDLACHIDIGVGRELASLYGAEHELPIDRRPWFEDPRGRLVGQLSVIGKKRTETREHA
jgi:hypothetical protein